VRSVTWFIDLFTDRRSIYEINNVNFFSHNVFGLVMETYYM